MKICGIASAEAFAAAADADWVGLVFVPASPRAVTVEDAAALSRSGPAGPGRVGLFVDPSDAEVAAVLAALDLAALQLHAGAARARALRARFGLPVWHALPVSARSDLPQPSGAAPKAYVPDAYVLDARAPADAAIPGGNGARFDWTVLDGWDAPAPWLLAGGLTPGNVTGAIAATGARAVDVSSGVERTRSVKDPALIRAFIRAAQAAPGA